MAESQLVCHEGKVVGFAAAEGSVKVKILSRSACSQCDAREMCSALEIKEKIIDAVPVSRDPLQIGDTVVVMMEEKLGIRAVFYGFVLPFIVLAVFFFASYALGSKEITSALLGIGSLVPYYGLLYAFRKKIEKDFIFKVEKK